MIRTAFSILLIAASIPVGLLSAAAQGNPRLKAEVTVAGDVVRIGDLIENAGVIANTPVFRAPDLGQTGAVPVHAVIDAVRRHGLIAVDARGLTEISVTHASNTIAAADIEQRIAGALTARYKLGTSDSIKIMFDREVRPILRPLTASAELSIARISYDAGSRRFDVSFEIPGADRQTWRYTGSAIETVEVAVPTRAFNRGDVVKASDFAIERRAKAEFSNEPPALPADVAGLAARRPVKLGQPLRGADLMKPELVKKNEIVMLHYEVPGVVLTMRGQALESGSEGDLISVLNVNSKRTIQGIVTGQGRVTILAPTTGRLAAASATE